MKDFIFANIPFAELQKNQGIYETPAINGKSIGVSYEDTEDASDVFIYNIFCNGEYINISGYGTKRPFRPLTNRLLSELIETWNGF